MADDYFRRMALCYRFEVRYGWTADRVDAESVLTFNLPRNEVRRVGDRYVATCELCTNTYGWVLTFWFACKECEYACCHRCMKKYMEPFETAALNKSEDESLREQGWNGCLMRCPTCRTLHSLKYEFDSLGLWRVFYNRKRSDDRAKKIMQARLEYIAQVRAMLE